MRTESLRVNLLYITGVIETIINDLRNTSSPYQRTNIIRRQAGQFLNGRRSEIIREFKNFAEKTTLQNKEEVQQLICKIIGVINQFISQVFPLIISSDPRSKHDSSYYFNKEQSSSVDETISLLRQIKALDETLKNNLQLKEIPEKQAQLLNDENRFPTEEEFEEIKSVFMRFETTIVPEILNIMHVRSIRFDEICSFEEFLESMPGADKITAVYTEGKEEETYCSEFSYEDLSEEQTEAIRKKLKKDKVDPKIQEFAELLNDFAKKYDDIIQHLSVWLYNINMRACLHNSLCRESKQ